MEPCELKFWFNALKNDCRYFNIMFNVYVVWNYSFKVSECSLSFQSNLLFSLCQAQINPLNISRSIQKKLARRKEMPPTATKGTSAGNPKGHRVQKFAFSKIKPFLITLTPALEKCKNKSMKAMFWKVLTVFLNKMHKWLKKEKNPTAALV